MSATYAVPRIARPADPAAAWDDQRWLGVPALPVAHFHPRSSPHRPAVEARLAHSGAHLHLIFRCADRWVRSVQMAVNGPVCRDSCVEFFVAPVAGLGYFNIEINAGGTVHCSHVRDHRRTPGGFADWNPIEPAAIAAIRVRSTLPRRIEPEIADPTSWSLEAEIPLALFAGALGRPVAAAGAWRANFYKCGDETSQPHWASWAPIGDELNFHQPDRFGRLTWA